MLEAPNVLEYPYTRSTGPVIGRFMTELRDGPRLLGATLADGRVVVPPTEYDPESGAAVDAASLVEVGPAGVVTTWSWVPSPRPEHPLDHPFAWALVRLDGADTAMLHAVDGVAESDMKSGMRVTARFADERVGSIRDLACFVAEGSGT
jgi:uncharacterized protein